MQLIRTWPDFVASVTRFLGAAQPVDAMARAGVALAGPVAAAFAQGSPHSWLTPAAFNTLVQTLGPPPPTRLHVGRRPLASPPVTPMLRPGGYQSTFACDLDAINLALATLWRFRQIPQQFSDSETAAILTLADLRQHCTGVPAAATALQGLILGAPPKVSAASQAANIHLELHLRVAVQGSADAGLVVTVHLEMPVLFDSNSSSVSFSSDAVSQAQVVGVVVDPTSTIVPTSAADQEALSARLQSARTVLSLLVGLLSVPALLPVPDSFKHTTVLVRQVQGITQAVGSRSFLVSGVNTTKQTTMPSAMGLQALPAVGNLRLAIDASLLNDMLAAMVTSGDLAQAINQKIASAVRPAGVAPVRFNGSGVTLADGKLTIALDTTWVAACAFGKDLGMTLRLSGGVAVNSGQLTLTQATLDVDLDDQDAVVCAVLGAMLGPFGLVVTALVLTVLASINPQFGDFAAPKVPPTLLPGTEWDLVPQFQQASTVDGALVLDGNLSLVPDPVCSFVYLRLVAGVPGQPVQNATVELLQLNSPAPADDDAPIPKNLGTSEQFGQKFTTLVERDYLPTADESLATQNSDAQGRVQFAVAPRAVAGILVETRTTEDARTGRVLSASQTRQNALEARPDFAITVTGADGKVLVRRMLVALNAANHHVGSFDSPHLVSLPVPLAH